MFPILCEKVELACHSPGRRQEIETTGVGAVKWMKKKKIMEGGKEQKSIKKKRNDLKNKEM